MRIYFATNPANYYLKVIKELNVPHVLISFHYFPYLEKLTKYTDGWLPDNLLIDSGAFTVWSQGATIDIDAYITFCESVKRAGKEKGTKVYFTNLDVLPGRWGFKPTIDQAEESAQKGWDNMEYMDSKGIDAIPVYHQHEDIKWLKKMMKHKEYIGISPANDLPQARKNSWLAEAFSVVQDKRKTHGFAVTSYKTLLKFPFYSVDSSSWTNGARFGSVPTFNQGKVKVYKYREENHFDNLWNKMYDKKVGMLEGYQDRVVQGAKVFLEMEKYLSKVWKLRGITHNE